MGFIRVRERLRVPIRSQGIPVVEGLKRVLQGPARVSVRGTTSDSIGRIREDQKHHLG